MWMKSPLLEAEDQVSCALEEFSKKTPGSGPAKSHNSAHHACNYKRKEELSWTNPGADGGAQLEVAHSHAAEPVKNA
jgi:hypothetical protein